MYLMKTTCLRILSLTLFITLLATSCGVNTNSGETNTDKFDREAMLAHWADNIILSAYQSYKASTDLLRQATTSFTSTPNIENLITLKATWLQAYTAYQMVALYQVGPDQINQVSQRTNIYPTNTDMVLEYAERETFNFDLPSSFAAQGYPAIEFLLYATSDSEVIEFYTQSDNHKAHLSALVNVVADNADFMLASWNAEYRNEFVGASGSSATASVNIMANRFVEYFERQIRANKVGIPAGIFSMEPLADKVEGLYAKGVSKSLYLASVVALQNFFNGQYDTDATQGEGFAQYLSYLEKGDIATDISGHLTQAIALASELNDDFGQQVIDDNTKMLALYDELQKAVILLKVDMMQALNIKITYVDADGD